MCTCVCLSSCQMCLLRLLLIQLPSWCLFVVATRSSHIADFYATKYYAKPQLALSNGLETIIDGLRKVEERKSVAIEQHENEDIAHKALRVVRAAIFSIQKCYWNSACECAIFIKTTNTYVTTEADVPLFSSKGFAMIHESNRLMNKTRACTLNIALEETNHCT